VLQTPHSLSTQYLLAFLVQKSSNTDRSALRQASTLSVLELLVQKRTDTARSVSALNISRVRPLIHAAEGAQRQ
jgi:hypothetical protein